MSTTATIAKAHVVERLATILADDWLTRGDVEDLSDGIRNLLPSDRRAKYPAYDPDNPGPCMLLRNVD